MALLVLLNNFMHDFSAAGWVFGSVLLWVLLRREGSQTDADPRLAGVFKTVLNLMRISVVGIVVFGIVRTLAYKSYEWNAAAGDGQVTLLIVKHIVLTAVFAFGVVYYLKACRYIRKALDEK